MKKLKVAIFCTNSQESPPPKNVIHAPLWLTYQLANSLVERGHSVDFFTVKGSKTKAKKIYSNLTDWPKNLEANELLENGLVGTNRRWSFLNDQTSVLNAFQTKKYDLIHAHTELVLPMAALSGKKTLITYHSNFKKYYNKLFSYYKKHYKNIFFNSLSKKHSDLAPDVKFTKIIYNGIDLNDFFYSEISNSHLVFAGRIIKEKGVHIALKVANKLNKKIFLVGAKYNHDDYWDKKVYPLLGKNVKYLRTTPYSKMPKMYYKAKALLLPVQYQEPFGLVMVEAMACGTPVVAFDRGSVPEVVKNGVTGFIVKNEKEMIKAVKKIYEMPKEEYQKMRQACRRHVEDNFSIEKMVDNYEKLYYDIIKKS